MYVCICTHTLTYTYTHAFTQWDQRDTTKVLSELQIDIASGTLIPFFDADTNLLYRESFVCF